MGWFSSGDTRTQQERLHNDHKNKGRMNPHRHGNGSSRNDARHVTLPRPGEVRGLFGKR